MSPELRIINQLDELQSSGPKAYWDLIDDLKESKKHSEASFEPVTCIWENYFKSLNSFPSKFQCKFDDMKSTLNIMEQQDVSLSPC